MWKHCCKGEISSLNYYLPHAWMDFDITSHATILHNKMMRHAHHPATFSQVKGCSLSVRLSVQNVVLFLSGLYLPHAWVVLILLHTIILHNTMMCWTYSQGQGHSLSVCPKCLGFAVSSTCYDRFWYYFKQFFFITRHIAPPPTPKVNVTVWV